MLALLFILFAGMAIGCGLAVVAKRNPLYSAISLVGVFISLACLYVMLAAPFIAAVQVIVYAGAIMVLVVFVIMLLNVEQEERRSGRLKFLVRGTFLFGLVSALGFLAKVIFFLFMYIWIRGTLPRFRYDQLMGFTWKFLFPVAMLNLLVTAFLVAWVSK